MNWLLFVISHSNVLNIELSVTSGRFKSKSQFIFWLHTFKQINYQITENKEKCELIIVDYYGTNLHTTGITTVDDIKLNYD